MLLKMQATREVFTKICLKPIKPFFPMCSTTRREGDIKKRKDSTFLWGDKKRRDIWQRKRGGGGAYFQNSWHERREGPPVSPLWEILDISLFKNITSAHMHIHHFQEKLDFGLVPYSILFNPFHSIVIFRFDSFCKSNHWFLYEIQHWVELG